MQWSEAIKGYIDALKPITISSDLMPRLIGLIDLTSLNDSDTEDTLNNFFEKAQTPFGHVPAVCIWPRFVRIAATQFAGSPIKTATVANFPEGEDSLENVLIEINQGLEDGAQEIDVVFPYTRYLAGERQYAQTFVASCKAACGNKALLKVILETGALGDLAVIADASFDALVSGADFIKTSTGKIPQGATFEAAAVMLLVIKHVGEQIKRPMGLKISGGVKDLQQAAQYIELADIIQGKHWVTPDTFRIGSSKLVDEVLKMA